MDNRQLKSQRLTAPQMLRLSEYGMFLAIIPGLLLSMVTGQFVFAFSPITLSLWLNLWRRSYGDRSIYQILQEQDQEAINRYDSGLESVRRERADFLIEHAGALRLRDHQQFQTVLDFRIQCVEKNRLALETYLGESQHTLEQELSALAEMQQQQQETLARALGQPDLELALNPKIFQERILTSLEDLFERVRSLQLLLMPVLKDIHTLNERLAVLDSSLRQAFPEPLSDQNSIHPDVLKMGRPLADAMETRMDHLNQRLLSTEKRGHDLSFRELSSFDECLQEMSHRFGDYLNEWDLFGQEHGDVLAHLEQKLEILRQSVEDLQTLEIEPKELVSHLISKQFSDVNLIEVGVHQECEQMKQEIVDIQYQCEKVLQSASITQILTDFVTLTSEKIESLTDQVIQPDDRLKLDSQIKAVTGALQQKLDEYDKELSYLTQRLSSDAIDIQLKSIASQLQSMDDRLSSLSTPKEASGVGAPRELYVQLAMIRVKLEELNTQVVMGSDQIPYLVESHIRQLFSPSQRSKLVSSHLE